MADTDFCLTCGKTIGMWDKTCRHCGANQFGDNNEFYPDEKAMKTAKKMMRAQQRSSLLGFLSAIFGEIEDSKDQEIQIPEEAPVMQMEEPLFSEAECLLYGIYPEGDETYRKALELDVLGKNYKK